jgi:hypothetical protein
MASRGAVDFVGEHDLREDWSGLETHFAFAVIRFGHDVGADDVGGHQVRRELDAREAQFKTLRERADQQCLSQSGRAFQQAVAAGEDAGQHAVDDVAVADHDLAHFVAEFLKRVAEFLSLLDDRFG